MSLARKLAFVGEFSWRLARRPLETLGLVRQALRAGRAADFSRSFAPASGPGASSDERPPNPFREFFYSRPKGRGSWKWDHYFDVYHRHFERFVGREVNVLEVGVASGGSLEMWRHYFGEKCRVYGVDADPRCKAYEGDRIRVLIGDQGDRSFWARVKAEIPRLDILIDDGGHRTEPQIATLEEMLPHLAPGGIYLCEDVLDSRNAFLGYANGLGAALNDRTAETDDFPTTGFQSAIGSIHFYPYVVVVEKRQSPLPRLTAPRSGSEWNV